MKNEKFLKESSYSINGAVKFLNENKLVSIKTETVYGLACNLAQFSLLRGYMI